MPETLRFKRDELVSRLKANREQHKKDYDEAIVVWRGKVRAELTAAVNAFESGKDLERVVLPPKPEQHVEDYDATIAMYEMTTEAEFTLDFDEFRRLVLDQWRWAQSFASNTKSYIGK